MSSSTPLAGSTEDNNQEKTMANTKVPSEDKSGSDSTVTEKNRENKIVKKYLNLHWINQGLLSKLKHNGQRNKIVKQYPYNYPVQMITNSKNRTQKT